MTVYDIPPLNGPKRLFIGGSRNGQMVPVMQPFKGQIVRIPLDSIFTVIGGSEVRVDHGPNCRYDQYRALPLQTVFGTHVWGYVHSSVRTGDQVMDLVTSGRCAMSICGVFFPK